MDTRIIVADDHQIVRQGLKRLLATMPGLSVVGEASTGVEAVAMANDLRPDVVIMDLQMPGLDGIDATRQLKKALPGVKVAVLSMHSDRQWVRRAIDAGAGAYVLKENAFEDLTEAIRNMAIDRVYLSPKLAVQAGAEATGPGTEAAGAPIPLSPREREVLRLIAEGRATKEVASDLKISIKTAETHRRQIMEKLQMFSVAELTKYAIRQGLTSIEV
jgi:DNA-binding NarL/FixJ family response regulator